MNFVCPVCSTKMAIPDKAQGRKVKCPKCHAKNVAEKGKASPINRQVFILGGALLAIVVFIVVMSYMTQDSPGAGSAPPPVEVQTTN